MNALFWLIVTVIDILVWVIIIGAIMSWLILFNVVNLNNRFVYLVYDSINRLTDSKVSRNRYLACSTDPNRFDAAGKPHPRTFVNNRPGPPLA